MAKFLGMNLQTDDQLLWIAHEALLAKLPEGSAAAARCVCVSRLNFARRWTEQRSDDGLVFFHHRGSGRSSWEHPRDAYYKFLCDPQLLPLCSKLILHYRYAKFSNMKKGGKYSNDGPSGRDRQMVDM
jgi:hypothetical protein